MAPIIKMPKRTSNLERPQDRPRVGTIKLEERNKPKYKLDFVLRQKVPQLRMKYKSFNYTELSIIVQIFWKLTEGSMVMNTEQLELFLVNTFNLEIGHGVMLRGYARFGKRRHTVPLEEFVRVLGILLYGTIEEKARYAFEIYDKKGNGKMSVMEVFEYLHDSFEDTQFDISEVDRPSKFITNLIFDKLNRSNNEAINVEDFVTMVKEDPNLLEPFCKLFPKEEYIRLFKKMFME